MPVRSYTPDPNEKINSLSNTYRINRIPSIRITDNLIGLNFLSDLNITDPNSITNVKLGSNVQFIGTNCFVNAINLKMVRTSNSLTSLGDHCFHGCTKLLNIGQLQEIKQIGNYAFCDCQELTSTDTFNSGNILSVGDYAFYNTGFKTLDINVSNNCENGSHIFSQCRNLQSISIKGSFKLKEETFGNDINLTSITIGDSVTIDGNGVFKNIPNIESIEIPINVTKFTNECFRGDSKLSSITFKNSNGILTMIGIDCFNGCNTLTELRLPRGITTYECFNENCFRGSGILSVFLPGIDPKYAKENKQYFTNFGLNREIFYIFSDGRKRKANNTGLIGSNTRAIICVNSNNSEIGSNANRWHNALLMNDIVKDCTGLDEDDIVLLLNVKKGEQDNILLNYKYEDPSNQNLNNALQKLIDDDVENLIFYFEDHGGTGTMVTTNSSTSNKTFWSYLSKIKGYKFCMICCCYAGSQGENAHSIGGVDKYLMWCASPHNEVSYRSSEHCKYCNGNSKHPSNKFSTAIIEKIPEIKEKTYDTAYNILIQKYGSKGRKYSSNFDIENTTKFMKFG